MEVNRYHEDSKVLTPRGYVSLQDIYLEMNTAKLYVKDKGFVNVSVEPVEISSSEKASIVSLSNEQVNISTADSNYRLTSGKIIPAKAVLNQRLDAKGDFNSTCNITTMAAMIPAMGRYNRAANNYTAVPADFRDRQDLFWELGIDPRERCLEDVILTTEDIMTEIHNLYGTYPTDKNLVLPSDIYSWERYRIAEFLKGLMTVYLNTEDNSQMSFYLPTEEMMREISDLLEQKFEIKSATKITKKLVKHDYLGYDMDWVKVYQLVIDKSYIPKFMTIIGLTTCCSVMFVNELLLNRTITAERVDTRTINQLINDENIQLENSFYKIQLLDNPLDEAAYILMGGVYVEIYR